MSSHHGASTRTPHGVPGQINIYVLDKDTPCTACGKHNRLVVFLDRSSGEIEIREDDIGLRPATESDRQRYARRPEVRLHGTGCRLHYVGSESDASAKRSSIWHRYRVIGRGRAQKVAKP